MKKRFFASFLTVVILTVALPLHAGDAVQFVYYYDYAPFGWEEDGKMRGIYIDIVNEVFTNKLGIPVNHKGYPWKRAQAMVKAGKSDGYCTTVTPERLSFSYATKEPIIEVNFKIYTPADNPRLDQLRKVKSVPELKGFKLADYSGSGWAKKNLTGLSIHWLPTNEQIWKVLINGRADAAVKNEWTTRYILKTLGYHDQIVELSHPMNKEPTAFHIFIGKKSPFTKYLGQLDDTIRQMRQDGTLKRIYDKYK